MIITIYFSYLKKLFTQLRVRDYLRKIVLSYNFYSTFHNLAKWFPIFIFCLILNFVVKWDLHNTYNVVSLYLYTVNNIRLQILSRISYNYPANQHVRIINQSLSFMVAFIGFSTENSYSDFFILINTKEIISTCLAFSLVNICLIKLIKHFQWFFHERSSKEQQVLFTVFLNYYSEKLRIDFYKYFMVSRKMFMIKHNINYQNILKALLLHKARAE